MFEYSSENIELRTILEIVIDFPFCNHFHEQPPRFCLGAKFRLQFLNCRFKNHYLNHSNCIKLWTSTNFRILTNELSTYHALLCHTHFCSFVSMYLKLNGLFDTKFTLHCARNNTPLIEFKNFVRTMTIHVLENP